MTEVGIHQKPGIRSLPQYEHIRSALLFLFIIACCLVPACGKKGEPTLKSYEKPDAPSQLHASHREDSINLSWSYPPDKRETIGGFYVYRTGGGGDLSRADFEKIAVVEKTRTNYADRDFKPDNIYGYKITAYSQRGINSNASNIIAVTPRAVPPRPGAVSFVAGNASLSITWQAAGEGVLYNVYKSMEKGRYETSPLNPEPAASTSYTDNITKDRPVYYTVRAVLNNDMKDEGYPSEEIEVNPESFTPSVPSGLRLVVTDDRIYLSWRENPETWIYGYRVYRKRDTDKDYVLRGDTKIPAFIDREKTAGRYRYAVTASGLLKESLLTESETIEIR